MTIPPTYDMQNDGMPANEPPKQSSAWLMTVADLFSLLLTFFVLLYSMSDIQRDKWEEITTSLMQRLNPVEEKVDFTMPDMTSIDTAEFVPARNLDYLYRIISEQAEGSPQLQGVQTTRLADAIRVTLPEQLLFAPGTANLQERGEAAARALGNMLSRIGNQIEIAGFTDPTPINTEAYPSNWELSLARSLAVANAFRQSGYIHHLAISGLGSSRYGRNDNTPIESRPRHARRVDVFIRENVAKK